MQFVFVIGAPFCGSTAVGNMLNTHPNIFHAGEVDRLKIFARYRDHDQHLTVNGCNLCESHHPRHNCPIWSDYPHIDTHNVHELVRAYKMLTSKSNKNVILDTSKNADWLAWLWQNGLQPCSAIVLSRNPFAFAYSHFKATGQPIWQGIEVWRNIYNHCLRVVLNRGIPLISVKHSDLLENPKHFFDSILMYLHLNGSIDYNNFSKYPCHALGGNVGAFVSYPEFQSEVYIKKEIQEKRFPTEEEISSKSSMSANPMKRTDHQWLKHIPCDEISAAISIPGMVDTMTLLGYDPILIYQQKIEWQKDNLKTT
ncbi:hypothetical protein SRCM100623_02307 [Acetobacter pasteurianus]|uniref:Sulfotransferase n=1 Tax=Acetobacter pasteurianus TaxID=438 RepID=A0A1A0D469_ACEPA|nr:sulfotransferase [Acetobacter pasteurianus]OAZ69591.1 hypothetical protein SRCM100623_02307 [Acetobacter pasteurianus]